LLQRFRFTEKVEKHCRNAFRLSSHTRSTRDRQLWSINKLSKTKHNDVDNVTDKTDFDRSLTKLFVDTWLCSWRKLRRIGNSATGGQAVINNDDSLFIDQS